VQRGQAGLDQGVGGCIGCTMPGFPDKFMPFLEAAPPAAGYHQLVRTLRGFTLRVTGHS
jgi:hydrogenase small subunit